MFACDLEADDCLGLVVEHTAKTVLISNVVPLIVASLQQIVTVTFIKFFGDNVSQIADT